MRKLGAFVVAVVIVVSAAALAAVFLPRTIRSLSLHRAEGRWRDAAIADYTWRIDTGCFGECTNGQPIRIVVRYGNPVHVSGPSSSPGATPVTVEQLFGWVERNVGADGYAVTFDPQLGVPTEGRFDPSRNSADDEWGFTVVGLHPD